MTDLYAITDRGRYEKMACEFEMALYFSPGCFIVRNVYELNNVGRNERGGLSGRVTWESFLEALGERFGWICLTLFAKSD